MSAPILHYGTFDVANYGDLLFPLILERRLGDLGPLIHVSPVGGAPPIAGGVTSRSPEQIEGPVAGVIVGGGHLIHPSPSPLADYRDPPARALMAYPSLWLGAAERALEAGAPLVWNAPGLPSAFAPRAAAVLDWASGFVDYLAVRDARSATLMRQAGCDREALVVPDSGFEVASLYSAAELERAHAEAFRTRGVERRGPTLAFHANARYLRDEIPLAAARIERIAEQAGAMPVLLALGACHGDDALVRALGARLRQPALVVDRPASLCELVACIAHAEVYLGSSLHGAITALAFGVKAALVAREAGDGGKFSGLLSQHGLEAWLLRDWEAAEQRFAALRAEPPTAWRGVAPAVAPALERHWTRVRSALTSPPNRPDLRATARERLENRVRSDLAAFGVHAALLAYQAEMTLDQMQQLARQREQTAALKASYRDAARALRTRIARLEAGSAGEDVEAGDPD
ncbi:MAG: polysaccharide pyruvyl transferase family protein [Deltaproteobacteria bacterium]|nr:polysaccharide pyruvyl transferase family protein [Deltaproteobacteria bacterium]